MASGKACIVGWGHSRFGKLGESLEGLIGSVAREALDHAGVAAADIGGIWLGHFNAGLSRMSFCSSLVAQADPGLRWKPATRVENACASGSAAVFSALDAVESGRLRLALVVGAEKMSEISGAEVTRVLASASYVQEEADRGLTFPGLFGEIAREYFQRYGDHSATLARIAAKNHANGMNNPFAHLRKPFDFDFCNTVSEQNPMVAAPLRRTDCSPVSDGAAALVIADHETARSLQRAVRFRARAQISDLLPMSLRNVAEFEGPRRAWSEALAAAGCRVEDLDFAEVHDCFTMAELLIYEAMGLAAPGQGARALAEGTVYRDGRLPVNASGGLKAKGHPIGATGVSMHAIGAMQLCGSAGAMQLPRASLGAAFNMGGAAVANYVSILERLR